MIRDFFEKDTILIDLNELDNLFTRKGIELTKDDTVSLFKNIYCCTTLKCKKKKGKLCMEKINKKNKICKIHKNSNTYDCLSRCSSPISENNNKININNPILDELSNNLHKKENNMDSWEEYEGIEDDYGDNKKQEETIVKDTEQFNENKVYKNRINILKNNLQKIDESNIVQILERYDYYNNNKDKLIEEEEINIEDISKFDVNNKDTYNIFRLMECLDGFEEIERNQNLLEIIKSFSIYLINTSIEEIVKNNSNNYYFEFIKNILDIVYSLIEETPLLFKIILLYDYTVLCKYIENF